jgi:hypothetical protein
MERGCVYRVLEGEVGSSKEESGAGLHARPMYTSLSYDNRLS